MAFKDELINQMSTFVTAAFGLVAALAWNGAIQSLFKRIFGTADTLNAQFVYALTVTVIAVVVTMWIARTSSKVKEHLEKIVVKNGEKKDK